MRTIDRAGSATLAAVVLLGSLARPGLAAAQPTGLGPRAPLSPGSAASCGDALSDPVRDVWRATGSETGRLGCPTEMEAATSTSPQGSAARAAVFGANGEIILHQTGPRAGQAYVVWGCFYRLFVQFGGTSGWLGLPVAETTNIPDGSRQGFEGGTMRYTRAYDECEATPSTRTALAPTATPATQTPLDIFEDPVTGDRLSLAARGSIAEALAAGLKRVRSQARVLGEAAPGATPLKLFWNEVRGLRQTLASIQSERDALEAGFEFEAGQGFIWSDPRPGALPLKQFRNPATGRTRLIVDAQDENEAIAKAYVFVRIEGYADPAP